jgi:hypothetical protein
MRLRFNNTDKLIQPKYVLLNPRTLSEEIEHGFLILHTLAHKLINVNRLELVQINVVVKYA